MIFETAVAARLADWLRTDDAAMLRADLRRMLQWKGQELAGDPWAQFQERFITSDCFRSVFDYRTRHSAAGKGFAYFAPNLKRVTDLYFDAPEIGPGIIVQHGHSTWISAERIGRDFTVNQNVTIGSDPRGRRPSIGNKVSVRTGAVITGGISIGDDVRIAPNAFVNFDVPSGSDVFPARSVIVARRPR